MGQVLKARGLKASGCCLASFPFSILILRKMLSRSRFISTRVLVWCRKRSLICCRRTLDRLLKFTSISFVFSKRSSLVAEKGHQPLCSAYRKDPAN